MIKIIIILYSILLISCAKEKPVPLHIQAFKWNSAVTSMKAEINSCDKYLVDTLWHEAPKLVDKIIPLVKERQDCNRQAHKNLTPEFFREKQNRRGWVGYVLPKDCTDVRQNYDRTTVEIVNGRLVARTDKGKTVDLSQCGGYDLPESSEGLKPHSYYTDTFLQADKANYQCLDDYVKQLNTLFSLKDIALETRFCNFKNHPNWGPWKYK